MLNFLFRGFTKDLKRSLKDSYKYFAEKNRKELNKLFDIKIYPLADKLDYVAKASIEHTLNGLNELENKTTKDIQNLINHADKKVNKNLKHLADKLDYVAKARIEHTFNGLNELEDKTVKDIQNLINHADKKVNKNLKEIDVIRQKTITDLRSTLGEADYYLENRINQITLSIMDSINSIETITNNTLTQATFLEEQLFHDANQIIDKINEIIGGETEIIRNELKKIFAHSLPNPFDRCRRALKLDMKPGMMLSDIELCRLTECYELNKIDENTQIDEVLQIYGQLQLNATRMAYLARNSPELKRQAVADWINYGMLCDFWRNTVNTYVLESTHENPSLLCGA